MTKSQCPQCKQWFEDENLDAHLLKVHGEETEPEESRVTRVLSEAQEARIRVLANEQNEALKVILIVTDLVILLIIYILWSRGLL